MEITSATVKAFLPAAITLLSMLVSGFFFFTNYLSANYVSIREYEKTETASVIIGLENQKHILENRLYFLQMCKALPKCPYEKSAGVDIEATLRELQDVRTRLENYQRSKLKQISVW